MEIYGEVTGPRTGRADTVIQETRGDPRAGAACSPSAWPQPPR